MVSGGLFFWSLLAWNCHLIFSRGFALVFCKLLFSAYFVDHGAHFLNFNENWEREAHAVSLV